MHGCVSHVQVFDRTGSAVVLGVHCSVDEAAPDALRCWGIDGCLSPAVFAAHRRGRGTFLHGSGARGTEADGVKSLVVWPIG